MATPRLRVHVPPASVLPVLLCLAMAPGAAHSQSGGASLSKGQTTSSLGDRAGAPAQPETRELRTENLTASVTVLRNPHPFPAGGSAFARIEIANTGKAARADAELVLEAETGVIRGVLGDRVKADGEARQLRVAKVEKIARGKPVKIIVEVGLRAGAGAPGPVTAQNRLKITLRAPGGQGPAATFGWDVANCAGAYYAEIVKVREGSGSGIDGAMKSARTRDKSRPGRWLFPPHAVARPGRKCLNRVKRWDRRRDRMVFVCTRYETPGTGVASPVKSERGIYRFASRLVSSRAIDRELAPTRDSGWAANRVSQNLQGFLAQDSNPALCTGAIKYFDYFDKRMAGFVKRADDHADMAAKSWGLAQLRTSQAIEAAKDDPGGHPGWGTAPLDPPQDAARTTLKHMIGNLAQLTSDASLSQSVSDAENAFAALRIMSDYLKSDAAAASDGATRASMRRALSAIEAADYIGAVARHYADLRHALIGSMTTLRAAHNRNCTCGG